MPNPGNMPFGAAVGGQHPEALIEAITVATPLTSLMFELPESCAHVELVYMMRSSAAATSAELYAQFNSDVGANYDIVLSQATNGSHTGVGRAGQTVAYLATVVGDTATAGVATHGRFVVPFYQDQAFQHSSLSWATHKQGTAVGNLYEFFASQWWRSTAPIRTITLTLSAGSFMVGSRFSLYGSR